MTLDKALRALTPDTFITRKGGPSVRLATGAELANMHRYVAFTATRVATFDASAADLASTDWAVRDLAAEQPSEAKSKRG